ncbi:hypothetical protein E2562_035310 [Oryza meyeriana var. granulata]|uniref:Uncharacterized protein n=1 Tax=Oryza meyeriana var. granulata TaxID=110450 RepID=A0A6G1CMH4_9ORYZ|nr:hypothetical protein E2562_035310 [Oryza meyeriana var. granulata]
MQKLMQVNLRRDVVACMQVGRIPFNQQIQNFESTVEQIAGAVGEEAAASMVAQSILFVGLGSNDYLNNYLMPNYNTRRQYNPRQFADLLADRYAAQLTLSKNSPPLIISIISELAS